MPRVEFEPEGFHAPRSGLLLLYGCVTGLFFLFLLRFWFLQVLHGEEYARQALENRQRIERTHSNRGLIFDSRGRLLAENRPAYCLALIRDDCPDIPGTLAQVSQWTEIPLDLLETKYIQDRKSVQSFEPQILVSDIPFDSLVQIEMKLPLWPGLSIVTRQRRHYPQGELFAHILGYVAEANEEELNRDSELALGDIIGKQGLELWLEQDLRGSKGLQEMEVDARGRQLTVDVKAPPEGGSNITLALDLDIQNAAAEALGDNVGSIVVMEPETGQVLALLTKPAYNNNAFASGISHVEWNALLEDPRKPLLNRGIQSVYPPGSVWKLMMAGLILSEGISPQETVNCPGHYQLGNQTFRCWRGGGHGRVDLQRSLVESCDVYYYVMAERIGIDKISAFAHACGFGDPTGIDLPHEQRGLVPDREWKRRRGEPWLKGETINVSIGQGSTLVTPLQIANYVSALLNGGKLMRPQLQLDEPPEVREVLPVPPESVHFIVDAMRATVEAPSGTAKRIARADAIMGGKTGTAQVVRIGDVRLKTHQLSYEHRDHAWMASWGEKDGKRYVVVVMVEHGGGGSAVAGPVTKAVYEYLFGPDAGPVRTAAAAGTAGGRAQ